MGQTLAPLVVAAAASFVARQLSCDPFDTSARRVPERIQWVGSGAIAVFLVAFAPTVEQVQAAYVVALLGWAAVTLGIARFRPVLLPRHPSIWSGQGDASPDAMSIEASSFVLRAAGAWMLMFAGNDLLWVLFVSAGSLVIGFLTDWVILLYLYLRTTSHR
jgi:hypothetical protein